GIYLMWGGFSVVEVGEFGFEITAMEPSSNKEESGSLKPFMIQKESGPLYPDLLVKFNTSELSDVSALDAIRQFSGPLTVQGPLPVPTGELMQDMIADVETPIVDHEVPSLVDIDSDQLGELDGPTLEQFHESLAEEFSEPVSVEPESIPDDLSALHELSSAFTEEALPPVAAPSPAVEARPARDELQAIFDELKGTTGDLT